MAIYKQFDKEIYFIHIPRTGGRYIASLFSSNSNIECSHHLIGKNSFRGIDETHLHYPLYNYYLKVDDIPHLTVVRNPVEKFVSSLTMMYNMDKEDYNFTLSSVEKFFDFITYQLEIHSNHNNWFLPQYKFLSPKTVFWKYEWGFGDLFKEWIFEHSGIEINLNKVDYEKIEGEYIPGKYKLSSQLEDFVKRFYRRDYEIFGY